jgi:hypothetical protein
MMGTTMSNVTEGEREGEEHNNVRGGVEVSEQVNVMEVERVDGLSDDPRGHHPPTTVEGNGDSNVLLEPCPWGCRNARYKHVGDHILMQHLDKFGERVKDDVGFPAFVEWLHLKNKFVCWKKRKSGTAASLVNTTCQCCSHDYRSSNAPFLPPLPNSAATVTLTPVLDLPMDHRISVNAPDIQQWLPLLHFLPISKDIPSVDGCAFAYSQLLEDIFHALSNGNGDDSPAVVEACYHLLAVSACILRAPREVGHKSSKVKGWKRRSFNKIRAKLFLQRIAI